MNFTLGHSHGNKLCCAIYEFSFLAWRAVYVMFMYISNKHKSKKLIVLFTQACQKKIYKHISCLDCKSDQFSLKLRLICFI